MAHFDLREIDPAADSQGYSQQEVADLRAQAQCEMLRCRRRADWCHEQRVTLALIGALILAFFGISDYLSAIVELIVIAGLTVSVIILHRAAEQSDASYRHWADLNRSFSEVSLEHDCEIDQLCKQYPAVSRYVDQVAASGRVLTYYELRKLAQWAELSHPVTRKRRLPVNLFGGGVGVSWSRRQPRAAGQQ